MGSLLTLVLFGFVLGLRHATDPDHVVAVSTIVSREKSVRASGRIGALWGLGHTMSILVVGGAILLLQLTMSQRAQLGFEFVVAMMLIVLGLANLLGSGSSSTRLSNARPVLVGIVHGLAGTAAVTLAILPLIPDARWSLAYLLLFGVGTIAGMALVTSAIAYPSLYATTRVANLHRYLRLGSGAVSVTFGLFLAHRVAIVDGLFVATR
jgi:high-affinity nickel-transport protein